LLVVSALALITLLIGDVIAAMEAGAHADETDEGLHHLFVFDLAWPIFLAGSVLTLAAGVGALLVGWLRRDRQATRFAAWSLGYIAVAVVVLFATGALEL
jgi:hypothetical protein